MTKFLIYSTLFLFFLMALVTHLLYFLTWLVGKCAHFSAPYKPFGWSALALVVLTILLISYGFIVGRYRTVVKEVIIENPDVPAAFDGYRMVHISDLHVSTFQSNPAKLEKTIEKINRLEPDLICFTGDMVSMTADELLPFVPMLRLLQAKDGVVAVLGNHDYATYVHQYSAEQKLQSLERLIAFERKDLGWHLLLNESMTVERAGEKLTIIGCENQSCSGNGISPIKRGELSKAIQGTDGFRVLLTHDPTHWRGEVLDTDIQLTLSGHTHAAQFRVLGWTPASWFYNENQGLYTEKGQMLYVNTGIGCTVPFRIGVPQEITVLTLKRK